MANSLANATSPYLRQHAGNPVDWHVWGQEAFEIARREDKPIFLSVGYSACHWCHVMAHESFEDEGIAAKMNALFVNVKVDREERPDVDALYMEAVQAMTGHGGWPLTAFLTPDGEPFYGGTYFPALPRPGMPSLPQVLDAVDDAWRHRRHDVAESAGRLTDALRASVVASSEGESPSGESVAEAADRLLATVDWRAGGLGGAPKFPQTAGLRFLLGRSVRDGSAELINAVSLSLGAMARGGIYDHLGGGFHRYSVDAEWAVPHFEKMLYDNAQLARLLVECWQVSGAPELARAAAETLDFVLREMTGPEGAFHAALDADSGGREGTFYTWTPDQIDEALPADEAAAAKAWFGVSPHGNFEGATVLSTRRPPEEVAQRLGISVRQLLERVESARPKLMAARSTRTRPETDTKVIAGWNALAIDALARAGAALGRPDFVEAAERAARFINRALVVDGGLAHTWLGGEASIPAFQDDFAALAGAHVTLYETTFDPAWLGSAERLVAEMIEQFADRHGAGFFRTGPRHDALVVRQKDVVDAAVPSGNAMAADVLLRLGALLGTTEHLDRAAGVARLLRPLAERAPSAFGAALAATDDLLEGGRQIAVVGPAGDRCTNELLAEVRRRFLPGAVLAAGGGADDPAVDRVPLLAGRTMVDGRPSAYVCSDFVCRVPVTEPSLLAAQLDEGRERVAGAPSRPEPVPVVALDVPEDAVLEADEGSFADLVLGAPVPVLVVFCAPLSGPCRALWPGVSELASEYAGRARVVKVDADGQPALVHRHGIQGFPTLILFRDGGEVARLIGAQPKADLAAAIEAVL